MRNGNLDKECNTFFVRVTNAITFVPPNAVLTSKMKLSKV
jgi:hypothetical protein